MWKRKDFFPSGSGETAPIFMVLPVIHAARSVGERALTIIKDGVCYNFVGKRGLFAAKNRWLNIENHEKISKELQNWRAKWQKKEGRLFMLANKKDQNWKQAWKELDSFQTKLWFKTYKIETLDNFADEIERKIIKEFRRKRIPLEYKFNLTSPGEPNRFQRMLADRQNVKSGRLSKKEYLKRYWYSHGNWNGGVLLDKKIFKKDLEEKIKLPNWKKIRGIHEKYGKRLDKKTNALIEILRTLSLWREERKVVVQKIALGYVNVSCLAAKELNVPVSLLRSTLRSEVERLKKEPETFNERIRAVVFLVERGKQIAKVLTGEEVQPYIREFLEEEPNEILRGVIASSGKAIGKARIILKNMDFSKFKRGEILVTTMTRPEFFPILKKAAAIITEEGGLTCHAAIISRELKIPCVVGVRGVITSVKDGEVIEVDADKGIIKKL